MPTYAQSDAIRRAFLENLDTLEREASGALLSSYWKALAKVEAEARSILEDAGTLDAALGPDGNPVRASFIAGRAEAIAEEFDRFGAGGLRTARTIAPTAYSFGTQKARDEIGAISGAFHRPKKSTVEQTLARLQKGTALESYFSRFGRERTQEAIDTIVESQIMGRSVPETVRHMRGKLDLSERRLRTMVRTEALGAARAGTGDSYRANSDVVSGWIWNAFESPTTCEVCWAMNGTYHDLEEDLDSHPNCRCVQSPSTQTFDEILAGGGFDPIGSEYETAARPFDADERFDRVLDESQKLQVLGPAKYRLWRDGEIRLRDLVRKTDHPEWGPGLRATTLRELKGLGVRPAPMIDALARADRLKAAGPEFDLARSDEVVRLFREKVGETNFDPWRGEQQILSAAVKDRGYDGLPKMLSEEERKALIIDKTHQQVYRGISGSDADRFADEFAHGEFFVSHGVYGDGVYATPSPITAASYAETQGTGTVMRMAIPKDAKILRIDWGTRSPEHPFTAAASAEFDEYTRWAESVRSAFSKAGLSDDAGYKASDVSVWAISKGYDAIHVGSQNHYILLNRSIVKLSTERTPVP